MQTDRKLVGWDRPQMADVRFIDELVFGRIDFDRQHIRPYHIVLDTLEHIPRNAVSTVVAAYLEVRDGTDGRRDDEYLCGIFFAPIPLWIIRLHRLHLLSVGAGQPVAR